MDTRKPSPLQVATLFDRSGHRKYLTASERRAFAVRASRFPIPIKLFCLTLLYTGARLSELLALTSDRIDVANNAIIFETLKRRRRCVFRAVPVPAALIGQILGFGGKLDKRMENGQADLRLWTWGRTTAWKHVKTVMTQAGIPPNLTCPKAARHAFGVNAIQTGVSLNVVQRWMGHAQITTTAIYADALGKEERVLAQRTWTTLPNLPR